MKTYSHTIFQCLFALGLCFAASSIQASDRPVVVTGEKPPHTAYVPILEGAELHSGMPKEAGSLAETQVAAEQNKFVGIIGQGDGGTTSILVPAPDPEAMAPYTRILTADPNSASAATVLADAKHVSTELKKVKSVEKLAATGSQATATTSEDSSHGGSILLILLGIGLLLAGSFNFMAEFPNKPLGAILMASGAAAIVLATLNMMRTSKK